MSTKVATHNTRFPNATNAAPAQPASPLRGFVPSCETFHDSIPRNRASDSMSCPVFMAGTDIPGLQPSCSIIITSTRAGCLGCAIVRRWRGGNMPSLGPAKRPTPSARAFPLSRPSASIRGSPLPPPQCPRALRPKPGLRGSPRHPGSLPVAPPGHPRFAPQARGCAIRNVATATVSPCFSTSLPCHRPLPEHHRCSAPKPGVARFSALPRVRIGKPQQPQRGCAEAPNVWSGPHRLGLHSCN